jgi:hypothetical protein
MGPGKLAPYRILAMPDGLTGSLLHLHVALRRDGAPKDRVSGAVCVGRRDQGPSGVPGRASELRVSCSSRR